MTIEELLKFDIIPFDIEDIKLKELFSFFLHKAPTIDSKSSLIIKNDRLDIIWNKFIDTWNENNYKFYSEDYFPDENVLKKYNLSSSSVISRKTKAFVCCRKNNKEKDYECYLRHIRNSIAHNDIYVNSISNRKYILIQDFNSNNKMRSMMLISQSELQTLKSLILKYKDGI